MLTNAGKRVLTSCLTVAETCHVCCAVSGQLR